MTDKQKNCYQQERQYTNPYDERRFEKCLLQHRLFEDRMFKHQLDDSAKKSIEESLKKDYQKRNITMTKGIQTNEDGKKEFLVKYKLIMDMLAAPGVIEGIVEEYMKDNPDTFYRNVVRDSPSLFNVDGILTDKGQELFDAFENTDVSTKKAIEKAIAKTIKKFIEKEHNNAL